jgi:ATP-dependent RNA helicase DeaD
MFDMGFVDDIKYILDRVPGERLVCLFSATMPDEVLRLAIRYMCDPRKILLSTDEISLSTIEQSYLIVDYRKKMEHLCEQIKRRNTQTIVFCATKTRTRRLAEDLRERGFRVSAIHGDLPQGRRDSVMQRFRKGMDDVLVATDLAARGIDVPRVGHVINYDVPQDPLVYFHRIGRTARAGGTGYAFTLVSGQDREAFERVLEKTEVPVKRLNEELGIEIQVPERRYTSYGHNRGYGSRSGHRSRPRFQQRNYYGLKSRW